MAREVGDAYVLLGDLQRGAGEPPLSNRAAAVASFTAAAQMLVDAAGGDPKDPELRERLARVESRLINLEAQVPPGLVSILRSEVPAPAGPRQPEPIPKLAAPGGTPVVPPPTAPRIVEFSADPAAVHPGQTVQLHWSIAGKVDSIALTPGGTVPTSSCHHCCEPFSHNSV